MTEALLAPLDEAPQSGGTKAVRALQRRRPPPVTARDRAGRVIPLGPVPAAASI